MVSGYSWTKVQAFKIRGIREKYRPLWEKIRNGSVRLDNLCAIHRGLWTGALYVFIVPEDVVKEYNIEREALRPALRGRDIKPFGFCWRKFYVIYASKEHVPDFSRAYPNAMRWLEKHKLVLQRRSAVFTWGREWWELEDPLHPEVFMVPKILSPLFARFQSFALDSEGFFVLDSTVMIRRWLSIEEQKQYALNWKKLNEPDLDVNMFIETGSSAWKELLGDIDGLWYITALLNSEVLEFFFKQYSPRLTKRTRRPKRGRWFSYMPPYLNILPIKIVERDRQREVVKVAKELAEKTREYISAQETVGFQRDQMESEIGFITRELNEIIFEIYDLDERERAIIQSFVYRKR